MSFTINGEVYTTFSDSLAEARESKEVFSAVQHKTPNTETIAGIMGSPDEPNEFTYVAMEAAGSGNEMYGPFDSVEALMKELNT